MAIETINNTPANSGTGDTLKVAFDKVNQNFAELEGKTTKWYANLAAFPATGSADTLYIAKNTNLAYTWVTDQYVLINPQTGETYTLAEKQKLAKVSFEALAADVTGTSVLDPTKKLKYWNLTGTFELTGVGTIPDDEYVVLTRVLTTATGVEAFIHPQSWNDYGSYDPAKRNLITLLVSKIPTGVQVDIIFNQPN